jgi:uncharacterized protein YwgA
MNFELPWIKCGVIAELTTKLEPVSPQFGKTVLQKMVFLLQEVYHVNVGYDFGFHTFGPFAAELLGDLNFAESMGFVTVKSVEETGGNGYVIESGDIIEGVLQNPAVSPFLSQHKEAIDALVKGFGNKTAKELELLTTIIYLNKEIMWDANKLTQEEAISKIRELKPKFSAGEIVDGMIELKTKHHVDLVFAA